MGVANSAARRGWPFGPKRLVMSLGVAPTARSAAFVSWRFLRLLTAPLHAACAALCASRRALSQWCPPDHLTANDAAKLPQGLLKGGAGPPPYPRRRNAVAPAPDTAHRTNPGGLTIASNASAQHSYFSRYSRNSSSTTSPISW